MIKWLRWQGLILFGLIAILVFLFWFLWVDILVQRSIEKTGTRVVGAKVELAEADIHLMPLGITLSSLQVTNPDKPMFNAVEAGRIDFSLDGLNLLRRKFIIDTMTMDGVRFNTARKTSGAVTLGAKNNEQSEKPVDKKTRAPILPSFQLPDIQEILAREKLESLDQIKNLGEEIDKAKTDWKKRLAAAPDQDTFEQYQTRAKKLQKGAKGISGALTLANDLKKLQNDVSKDLKQLKDIQKDFNRDKQRLQKKLDRLKTAPRQDMDRILNTYSLSADGLGNISQLLFGEKIGGTVRKAIFWYGKLSPLLAKTGPGNEKEAVVKPERGRGVHVHFKETAPLPDLLARRVGVSMVIPAGDIRGELRQVTTDQTRLGIPLEFNFSGDKLQGVQAIKIRGALDHIDPSKVSDRITMGVEQYRVKDFKLSAADNLPITLKNGLAHMNLEAVMRDGNLDAHVDVVLDGATLETEMSSDGNQLQQALHSALADISSFAVNAKVTGPLDDYRIKMTSDLDKVLKNALGKQIKNLTNEFQDKLRAGITEKIKEPMAEASGGLSGLDSITQELSSRLNIGNDVLKKQLKLGF